MKIIEPLVFDIMINDRFECTMKMPVTPDVKDGKNEFGGDFILGNKVQQYVEKTKPYLKNKDYRIRFY